MGIVGKSFGNSVWEERRTFIVSPRNRAFKTRYVAISPVVSPHGGLVAFKSRRWKDQSNKSLSLLKC